MTSHTEKGESNRFVNFLRVFLYKKIQNIAVFGDGGGGDGDGGGKGGSGLDQNLSPWPCLQCQESTGILKTQCLFFSSQALP